MTLVFTKLKEISVFIYTLVFLLVFNLYFNLNFTWYGLSIIVRIYLLVFSFYLVFIFASLDINYYVNEYIKKFGNKGKIFIFFETRAFPFLFILLITILYTLIDYIREPNWPWSPILTLLNGRHSNNIIYAWILLNILKLKIKPSIQIVLFISISLIYFWIFEKAIFYVFESGTAVSCIKLIKITIFLFFLFHEFYSIFKGMIISVILTLFFYFTILASFLIIFNYSKDTSFKSKEAGFLMIKMGYTYPVKRLKLVALKSHDYDLIRKLLLLEKQNNIQINYTDEEWKDLLLSGTVNMTDFISKYILNEQLNLSYNEIIQYAEQKSKDESHNLERANNFIKLSSKYYKGNEIDFFKRLKESNNAFKIWGIKILRENKDINSIPILLSFLTEIEDRIANNAYEALKLISDLDPATALDKKINDPDVIAIFYKYFKKYSKTQ